jgi:hypothetical protein
MAIGKASPAVFALAAATLVSLPTTAAAAPRTIAPSGTSRGQPAHSGEGSPATVATVVPLRVADPAAYAREKQRAAQLAGANAPLSAAGALGSTSASAPPSAPAAAVFASLNAAGLSASQQIATFGTDVTPPDTTGAIGPEHYVEFVNEEVAAYQRANLAIVGKPVALSTFTGGVAVCDPQIKYDPKSSRWFYAAIRCDRTTTGNALYLGFSKTSDPTDFSTAVGHGWCGYSYGTSEVIEDYPKLGLDSLHIIIGSNSFNARSGAFVTAHILSLPKPASGKIETCPAAPKLTTFGSPLRTSVENHIAITPEPATVADESPSGFVLAADVTTPSSGNGSHLMIWQVAGTAEKPELTALGAPAVTEFKIPPNVPQPGSVDELDSFDSRLTQAVAAADPSAGGAEAVWTQHTIAGGAGSVVRWYELLPGKLEVRQAGTISDTSRFVFNGAVAPTLSGGAVINYDTASSSAFAQIMAQSRLGTDPAGTMTTPIALASSAAIDSDFSCPSVEPKSTACRWGDYAGASVDPTNTNVVWGSNQVNGPAGAGHSAQWATQNFALTPLPNPPTVVTQAASAVTQTSATLNASVNPNGGEVSECKFEYGPTASYGSSVSCSKLPGSGTSPVPVSAPVAGLSPNTIYHFRISATNAGGTSKGADALLNTLPNSPTVVTKAASEVTQSSATLNASVNPNGGEVSECKFEYGTTTSYGSSAPCAPAPGSGTSPAAVSAALSGLSTNTTYHFRIFAKNAGGVSTGSDQTFTTTLPIVVTEAATAVTQTSATLHATVNPNGIPVSECRFDYGTSTSYGQSAPCTPAPGSGTSPVAVSAALESLAEGTTYHFRVAVTDANGTSTGSDQTFTTLLVLGPHWYEQNVRLGETSLESGPLIMAWGSLTLENAKVGAFTCQSLAGGDLSNPVGGGAGKGLFDAFAFYDCVAPTCEATKGLLEVVPERLKWSSVLIEEAGVFRDRIEGIALHAICVGGEGNVQFHGSLKPEFEAGSAQGSAPAHLAFGAGSGSLESAEGAGTVVAKLRFMGFGEGQFISARKT